MTVRRTMSSARRMLFPLARMNELDSISGIFDSPRMRSDTCGGQQVAERRASKRSIAVVEVDHLPPREHLRGNPLF
jgi:hypothetical protein